jgi:hypothetical protein
LAGSRGLPVNDGSTALSGKLVPICSATASLAQLANGLEPETGTSAAAPKSVAPAADVLPAIANTVSPTAASRSELVFMNRF